MHMRGTTQGNTVRRTKAYDDVAAEVRLFLADRIATLWPMPALTTSGSTLGFEFAKSAVDNVRMLQEIPSSPIAGAGPC